MALSHGVLAQEALPKFEVASIKVNPKKLLPWFVPLPGGKINYSGVSLKDLIEGAWSMGPGTISGGPGWVDSILYDILAKAEDGATQGMSIDQILQYTRLMMRSLLIERFHVAVHFETREAPIYALVIARKDGKLGPGLKQPKEGGCEEWDLYRPFVLPEKGKFPELMCGQGVIVWNGTARAAQVELKQLAGTLSTVVGSPVVDETGLKQKFDIDMQWSNRLVSSDNRPSVFTAIEEQLGLKLESRKGPVNILVIDRADPASEN